MRINYIFFCWASISILVGPLQCQLYIFAVQEWEDISGFNEHGSFIFTVCLNKLFWSSFRLKECSDASTRACEIRKNRPNYRAISEHDGLFWHQGNSQVSYLEYIGITFIISFNTYMKFELSILAKYLNQDWMAFLLFELLHNLTDFIDYFIYFLHVYLSKKKHAHECKCISVFEGC